MKRIAHVLVNIPTRRINKLFSYAIPEPLSFVSEGWRVWVPFGARRVEGFITGIEDGDTAGLKEIIEVWDADPWFDEHMLTVARWLRDYYLCSLGEALRLFIPGGSSKTSEISYKPAVQEESAHEKAEALFSEDAMALWQYIAQAGPVKHQHILKKFGSKSIKALRGLLEKELIFKELAAKSKGGARFRTEYRLSVTPQQAVAALGEMRAKPAQRRVIELLLSKTVLEESQLKEYKIAKAIIDKLIQLKLVNGHKIRVMRDSYSNVIADIKKHELTSEQKCALDSIGTALERRIFQPFLLHGITGSGKTEVYIEATAKVREQNRQAIILVPEIALTSQLVERFKARFGSDVTVIHSRLSLGERNDAWEKMHQGQAGIAIGARSAVFAPFPDLGLVILDEEHEFTYKQEETPRYHAREVALMRSRLAGAVTVLGSATPSIETYHRCLTGEFSLLCMPTRVSGLLPEVKIVDLREELRSGNRSVISTSLYDTLASAINRREQAIILLNRRGYATFVLCRECGHVMKCDHCSVSLVYHATGKKLRCHYCQRSSHVPDQCPQCRSRYIRYFGSGTQKVEEELKQLLPVARVLRMDQDTTGKKFSHEQILADFKAGNYDILLGTQMVAKGHDIKNVTAVGIISADTALNLPDFRAAEKTFALIMQAAGRAGRGQQPGRVVVQTYNPEHYAIRSGAKQDYLQFFHEEIGFRKVLGYPPYSQIVKITVHGPNETGIRSQAEQLVRLLKLQLAADSTGSQILGPFSAAVSKVDDVFRMNILIKAPTLPIVQKALQALELDAQPGIIIDVDPVNAM